MNERVTQFFYEFHHGLPRLGPGSEESTRRAFDGVRFLLPQKPRILDLGCGNGAQTLVLAEGSPGTILAVDNHAPFISELTRRAAERGVADRIEARVGDMFRLDLPKESFDLIWSEGAVYLVGFEKGLREWRELLRPGGMVAVTEASWLRADAPEEVRAFWAEAYPAMQTVSGNLDAIRRAGFAPFGNFTLPESCWSNYVDPLEQRIAEVLAAHPGDPDALAAAEAQRRENELFRTSLAWFGYVFYLMRKV